MMKVSTYFRRLLCLSLVCASLAVSVSARQGAGALRGQIFDEFGGVIVGATVTVVDGSGKERTATTDGEGNFQIAGLAPGAYTVRAHAPGFAVYENTELSIVAGRNEPLRITLGISLQEEEVTIASEGPLSLDNNSAGAIVLKGKDLEALPDDPDELAAALQALAGPSVGPNGGQIMIDGFEGGRIPPKESIREVRVNDNPLSAENDRPGFGGIQIFTKPGTDRFRGTFFSNFNDESLNSRNPFAERRADFQSRHFGGNLSGTIVPKRSSFFLDVEKNFTDDNDIVNATVLDPSTLAPASFVQTVLTPSRRFNFSPRVDYQINGNHTLVARYNYNRNESENLGVSTFSLPERAFDSSFRSHTVQLTETAILSKEMISETRFQFIKNRRQQDALNEGFAVNVLDAFSFGGASVGDSFYEDSRWELSNTTTLAKGLHSIKFGGRLRGIRVSDFSENNFNGTFNFGGGLAREVGFDGSGRPTPGAVQTVSSIERYRRTQQLLRAGASAADIAAFNLGATQLTINGGEALAEISQIDFGGFIQEDWKVRPNLTLGAGLRYETQSNIDSPFNFAPRLSLAWSPDGTGGRQPKTVIRLGWGMFYDRVAESLSLQAARFNGVNQQQFIITAPAIGDDSPRAVQARQILASFPVLPSVEQLSSFSLPQVTRRLAPDLQAPYSYTTGLLVERQLPARFTAYAFLMSYNTRNLLRSRNVNAPTATGQRPNPELGDVYQFESSGTQNMRQMNVGVRNQISRAFSVFANYNWGKAESDADGAFSFPADQYDLSGEYGRTAFDARHRFSFGGSFGVPYLKLSLNPIVIARTGMPFNITTGFDNNRDGLFNDRPAFADSLTSERDLRRTAWGDFDVNPKPGQTIVPRNFGEGPGFFSVNLRISRQFSFGARPGAAAQPQSDGQRRSSGGRGGSSRAPSSSGGGAPRVMVGGPGGHGGPGGPGGVFVSGGGGGGGEGSRYNLALSLFISNLFNRTNLANPVGNLSSPSFGQSLTTVGGFGGGNSAAGNRRVQASLRFTF